MKFRRNAVIFKGPLDAAPWACLFVLLSTVLLIKSVFFRPTGVTLALPTSSAGSLPATAFRTLLIDDRRRLHFDNQIVDAGQLAALLEKATARTAEPLALAIQADREISWDVIADIHRIAVDAGFASVMALTSPDMSKDAR